MNRADALVLRARQILGDPALDGRQRIANPAQLLEHLRKSVERDPGLLNAVLDDIADDAVREQMRQALTS